MIKKSIPNFITCLNLLCGCIGIVFAFEGNLIWSAYMVGIAAVLDFLDGFAARMLKVYSDMGKQLDSLADMVTFGMLPGVVMYHLIYFSLENGSVSLDLSDSRLPGQHLTVNPYTAYLPYFAFLIPVFSAIRLARFNLDSRQSDSFIGLPTPANAIFIVSLWFIIRDGNHLDALIGKEFSNSESMPGEFRKFYKNPHSVIQLLLINPNFLLG